MNPPPPGRQSIDGEGSPLDVPGYQPVSRLAVAAAAVGGVSALALASPVFWVLPLVGTGIAIAALRDVDREGARKAGRLIALAGLALSIGFGAQAVTAKLAARSIASERAAAAAQLWLATIREDRRDDARSMCSADAAAAVDTVAACGMKDAAADSIQVRCAGQGETEGSWLVRAGVGGCTLAITLEPAVAARQGRTTERWMITKAETVRPSGN